MFRIIAVIGLVGGAFGSLLAAVAGSGGEFSTEAALEQQAAQWHEQGPAGLDAALARLKELSNADHLEAMDQMRRCVDLTAGQRDAWVSRLYWYTDLDEARVAAEASGKPILSLRLLGKLTDEYSCANSRYFRTALYANEEVSAELRDHFILHWQSVRPVPHVTIDFGDGRKLERTITGNSAHYILDASGRPLDVLPGMYGPEAFQRWLMRSAALHDQLAGLDAGTERDGMLAQYHSQRRTALDQELQADLLTTEATPTSADLSAPTPLGDEVWQRVAELARHAVKLDLTSRFLMRREFPAAAAAGVRAASKFKVEDPLLAVIESFQGTIALDAVKNEYLLHRKIHDWFAAGQSLLDVDGLNERVYAELFLTPSSDPWLGLAPSDAFTGLDNGGLTTASTDRSQLGVAQ